MRPKKTRYSDKGWNRFSFTRGIPPTIGRISSNKWSSNRQPVKRFDQASENWYILHYGFSPVSCTLLSYCFHYSFAQPCRAVGDDYASGAHGFDLVLGTALAARHNRPGVAHAAPRRRGAPGDETRHRL